MEVTPEASLDLPKPTKTPEESPAASPVSSDDDDAGSGAVGSDSDTETLDEQASNLVEQEVWDNAKAEFSIRLPRSFEECKRNSKHYACPPEEDMNGESDDEEWLRLKSTEKSANKYYHVLFGALSNKKMGNTYYHYEQRTKLQYVANIMMQHPMLNARLLCAAMQRWTRNGTPQGLGLYATWWRCICITARSMNV